MHDKKLPNHCRLAVSKFFGFSREFDLLSQGPF
jgi:hypothetical protein